MPPKSSTANAAIGTFVPNVVQTDVTTIPGATGDDMGSPGNSGVVKFCSPTTTDHDACPEEAVEMPSAPSAPALEKRSDTDGRAVVLHAPAVVACATWEYAAASALHAERGSIPSGAASALKTRNHAGSDAAAAPPGTAAQSSASPLEIASEVPPTAAAAATAAGESGNVARAAAATLEKGGGVVDRMLLSGSVQPVEDAEKTVVSAVPLVGETETVPFTGGAWT